MKSGFCDAIALRYVGTPSRCHHYARAMKISLSLMTSHCPKGGYTYLRHNELRDYVANLLSDVCHDVEMEHHLQPLQGEAFNQRQLMMMQD